jgi:hypothetical protein
MSKQYDYCVYCTSQKFQAPWWQLCSELSNMSPYTKIFGQKYYYHVNSYNKLKEETSMYMVKLI